MKLIRFGEAGKEKPGVIRGDGRRIDVSDFVKEYDEAFFADGGLKKLASWLQQNEQTAPLVGDEVRLGRCNRLGYSSKPTGSKHKAMKP